jgi:hypothetical protein
MIQENVARRRFCLARSRHGSGWPLRFSCRFRGRKPNVSLDSSTQTEIEAAAFRRLLQHLREHPEVQNIDLMITADFCRNCLAKWLKEAAEDIGEPMDDSAARELIYGEPYAQWKEKFQREATPEQLEALKQRQAKPNV